MRFDLLNHGNGRVVAVVLLVAALIVAIGSFNHERPLTLREESAKMAEIARESGEAITKYAVHIEIDKNGHVLVTKKFSANVQHKWFKLGGFFEYPVKRTLPDGTAISTKFRLMSITRDGKKDTTEEYPLSKFMTRRYIYGKTNLAKGLHTFEIKYQLKDIVDHYVDSDRLMLPVVEEGWRVPVKEVAVRVSFPPQVMISQVSGRGLTNSTEVLSNTDRPNNQLILWTNGELKPFEGMGVEVRLPPGAVKRVGKVVFMENPAVQKTDLPLN